MKIQSAVVLAGESGTAAPHRHGELPVDCEGKGVGSEHTGPVGGALNEQYSWMVRPGSGSGNLKESRSVGRELQVEGGWCGQREELQRIHPKQIRLIDKRNSLKSRAQTEASMTTSEGGGASESSLRRIQIRDWKKNGLKKKAGRKTRWNKPAVPASGEAEAVGAGAPV